MLSYAVDWSFDASAPRGFRWPIDPTTGQRVPGVWRQWMSHSPMRLLDDPAVVASGRRSLDGNIFISVGRNDQFKVHEPARRFSAKLTRLGIRHRFESTDDGHFRGTWSRMSAALAFALKRFSRLP